MPQPLTAVDPALPTVLGAVPPALAQAATDPVAELDRQVEVLAALGVAAVSGLGADGLRVAVRPLREALPDVVALPSGTADGRDHAAFVLVVAADVNDAVPAMRRGTRHGVSVLGRADAAAYRPLADLAVPTGPVYLLLDVDTGREFRGITPEAALGTVRERGRTPLTVAEGVALATVRPDLLRPNLCFSLAGSRDGSQRVPAIWISDRRPKLGWCWDRNPHTWLGMASAARRLAPPPGSRQQA